MYEHFAKPTITYCENNVLSYVAQPANAWSNLAFILIGIYLLFLSRNQKNLLLKFLGPMALLIGLCSFFYHASYTFVGQFLDLGSMFLASSYLLVFNLHRLSARFFTIGKTVILFFVLVSSSLTVVYFIRPTNFTIGLPIFSLQVLTILILELQMYKRRTNNYEIQNLLVALALLIAAFIFWNLDFLRLWCNPNTFHLINGHALWHILNSLVFIFLYSFYTQFD